MQSIVASPVARRLKVGAEVVENGTHFRVWAPKHRSVQVVFEAGGQTTELQSDGDGYFAGLAEGVKASALYRFRLQGDDNLYPDPASRCQPNGPHGPSMVIDPLTFEWADSEWKGCDIAGQVLYEMHIGTFTPAGDWASATAELQSLKDLGITCIEVMPVNEFSGSFGWGYDGVDLFAPYRKYGVPDAFRTFVDAAHRIGLSVILDVVYNHFGPDGNYVRQFSDHYFNAEHMTDWGEAINFDGEQHVGVRDFFVANAVYWVTEFHLDGFRFDATQAIVDTSADHILAEIDRAARAAVPHRKLYLINENEPQDTRLIRNNSDRGGYGLNALWNDDFHHAAMVTLSGHHEAYYMDYRGKSQEFISAAKYGYLYQGQRYEWQKARRGTPALDLPPTSFVHFLQNHDQVANSGRGYRAHQLCSPAQYRAMTGLLLLMPQTPLLFQGQEFAASSPFLYFADHDPKLSELVRAGRARELSSFPSIATPQMLACLSDPGHSETFFKSKLDLSERTKHGHAEVYRLHKDLLTMRRTLEVFARVQRRGDFDSAILSQEAFVLRYFGSDGPGGLNDRLMLVNFGSDLDLRPCPEPLLAPILGHVWEIELSTEDPVYGGLGTPPPDTEKEGWMLPGRCTVVMRPIPAEQASNVVRGKVEGSSQKARKRDEK